MARLIDEGMIAQLSKKQGYFLKYFPARIRNVGEDAKEDRKLIYAFKDARDDAYKLVAQMVDGYLKREYGEQVTRLRGLSMPESTVWRHPDTIRTRTIDPSQPFPMVGTVRSRMTQDRHRTTRHQACRITHSLVGTTDSPYARMNPPSDSRRLRHRDNLAMISPHNFTVSAGPFTLTALVPAFAAG